MITIVQRFSKRCDEIVAFLDIVSATVSVAKTNHKVIKSRSVFIKSSQKLKNIVVQNQNFTLTAYDGSFLTLCAEFEMSVREIIDKFVLDASTKCVEYHHLPKEMRDWYPDGCANLILEINHYKFSHLTKDQIIRSLASCVKIKNFNLVGDAFSDNQHNFRSKVLEEILSIRIGFTKIWQKLSREKVFQELVGSAELSIVERQLRDRLDKIMDRRNDIIHRGRSYFTPSESEIRESTLFLKVLVTSLGTLIEQYLNQL